MKRERYTGFVAVFACTMVAAVSAHTRPGLVVLYPTRDAVHLQLMSLAEPGDTLRLEDGRYVFQVTEPSGKALLSTDAASCRQFDVVNGTISGVVATGCEHRTGFDVERAATTVQLMPYKRAMNRGAMYKTWVVKVDAFLAACAALGVPNGLSAVSCGVDGDNVHGFTLAQSRTYSFKVRRG
jgi:hypothetical protein